MMGRMLDVHTEIEEMLSHKSSLWQDELERVELHLETCERCRAYAAFLAELEQRDWSPYSAEEQSPQNKKEVFKMIEAKQSKPTNQAVRNLPRVGRVFALMAVFIIVGTISFLLFNPNSNVPENLAFGKTELPARDYDGWEQGVAYDLPKDLTHSTFILMGGNFNLGSVMGLGNRPVTGEKLFSPWNLEEEEVRAMILVKNPRFDLSGEPIEHMREFSMYFNGPTGNYQLIDMAGRQTYFLKSSYLGRDFVDATFFVNNRLTRIYIEARADQEGNKVDIHNMAEQIMLSMVEVDYSDWRVWEHPELDVAVSIPKDAIVSYATFGEGLEIFNAADVDYQWSLQFHLTGSAWQTFDDYFLYLEDQSELLEGAELIEGPIKPSLTDTNQTALYKLSNDKFLLAAAFIDPVQTINGSVSVMTLMTDQVGLNMLRPIFDQALRSVRTKSVPLIIPDVMIKDPSYGQFGVSESSFSTLHVGTEMVTDFRDHNLVIESFSQVGESIHIDFFMVLPEGGQPMTAGVLEGHLVDARGNEFPYKSGNFYAANWQDDERYHPPNSIKFKGVAEIDPTNEFAIFVDVILYYIQATDQIVIEASEQNWGDRWPIDQTTYFNGAEVTFTEAWLDATENNLKLSGALNSDNVLYPIKRIYQSGNSNARFKLTEEGGEQVELAFDLIDRPSGPLYINLQATIQYENAVSTLFRVNENGEIIVLDNQE